MKLTVKVDRAAGDDALRQLYPFSGRGDLAHVLILSHGTRSGIIGSKNNNGIYLNELKGWVDKNPGAVTVSELGNMLKRIGFTPNAFITLGGCNLGLGTGLKYSNAGWIPSGGFAGELAKSSHVPVIASSPSSYHLGFYTSGTTSYHTCTSVSCFRWSDGAWYLFNPSGSIKILPDRKIKMSL